MFQIRRREFLTAVGGAVIAGPRIALAQSSSKVFRLGTLTAGLAAVRDRMICRLLKSIADASTLSPPPLHSPLG